LATVWVRAGLLAAVVAFGLSGCQALQDALPTQNSEPKPSPSQSPVAIPVVVPQPTPTPILGVPGPAPSPTPTSSPGPAPTPTPAPPSNGSCSLPPSNSPNAPCVALSPLFLASVENAITQITQQQPSIFGPPTSNCPNCYFVKDVNAYVTGVIRNLNAAGFCGHYDGEELGVKNTNSFNEQYDILLASGHIRRGSGAYRTTCTPSWF
jgi:hypothetical protein